MNDSYDDFMEENAPCSTESFPPSRSRSSTTSSSELSVVRLQLTLIVMSTVCVMAVIVFAIGCNRTVLVPESSPIRVGPSTRGQIYTLIDGEWKLSAEQLTLPEGWWVVPPSFVDPQPDR